MEEIKIEGYEEITGSMNSSTHDYPISIQVRTPSHNGVFNYRYFKKKEQNIFEDMFRQIKIDKVGISICFDDGKEITRLEKSMPLLIQAVKEWERRFGSKD